MAEQTLKAEQLSLFNVPVIVGPYQRADGTVVQPHVSMRRKGIKPAPKPEHRAVQHLLFSQTAPVQAAPPEPEPEPAAAPVVPRSRKRRAKPASDAAPLLPPTVGVSQFGAASNAKPAERKRDNARAIAILEEKTDAQLTPEDVAVLARYSGRGGIGDHLNEFYTRPDVATAMWDVVRKLGVDSGRICEPSCGTGVFLHTAPAGVVVSAAELDAVSSRIARALHPEHEVNATHFEAFAKTDPRLFDAFIGNVPFGLRGSFIKDDKPDLTKAEQYFLDTALDKTRAGGAVALIVPTGIMDGANNRAFRENLLRKGEFIAAHRLPNTAFGHSHTEVTSDIVLFRRRDPAVAQALQVADQDVLRKLGIWDEEFLSGGYFGGRGAALVYGRMEDGWRAKAGMGHDITVSGDMEGVAAAIADWAPPELPPAPDMAQVLAALPDDETRAAARRRALRTPYEVAQIGDTKMINGVTYVLQGEPPRWRRVDDEGGEPEAVVTARQIGERIEKLARGEGDAGKVAAALQAWIYANGNPRNNTDLVSRAGGDKALHRVIAAVNADGSFSDLLTERKAAAADSMDSTAERLSLDAGSFTADRLAHEIGADADAESIEDALHASDRYASLPDGGWQTIGAYLTGELWPKLDAARERLAADVEPALRVKLEMQVRRLEEAINPKMLDDVEVMLNSAWVPVDVLSAFFNARIDEWKARNPGGWSPDPMTISFDKGVYKIEGGFHDSKLIDQYLNRTGVRSNDRDTLDTLNADFKRWLLDSEHRERVEDIYNRAYTGFARQQFSDEPIEVPGMSPDFDVNRYHWSGVRRMLEQRSGIIAADVGVGKTPRGLIIARLLKAYGRAKKPGFVIPKSILAKWAQSAQRWFPDAKIMVVGETYSTGADGQIVVKQDSAATRNRKLHEVAQNDYDFVFISAPAWNEIDLSLKLKNDYVSGDFWMQRGDQLGGAGDKRVKRVREAYEQSVAGRDFQKRSDVVAFDDLGIDALFTDEAHAYKNLFAARNRFGESPKFLGGSGLSNRALDSVYKCRFVLDQNDGGNVFDLTATPTKNSPLEIYSMLMRSAPQAFEKLGIRNSEEFLDRFCVFENRMTLGINGSVEDALCTTGFKNLDELRGVMDRYIDRTTAEDVGLVLPDPEHVEHIVDMNDDQRAVYAELRELAEKTTGGNDATGDAHVFSIMDKMSKAATDLSLLGTEHAGAVSPKLESVADRVRTASKEGGSQLVFCEFVDAHEKIKDALVARGFKPSEIGIINARAAKTSLARQRIAEQLNDGTIKVVIGNKTMEEGLDMQKKTTDIHHVDIPWDPSTLQQRNGRGRRQGNRNERIRIHRYLSRGSFDGYRYQTVSAKRDWMNELWSGGDRVDNLAMASTPSREDMLVMLAADPDEARRRIAESKTAATERMDVARRADAAAEFVRFRSLSRSYSAAKNKTTQSAVRLQSQLAAVRHRLESSKHFTAKDALDHPDSVIVDPQTGGVWRPGMAFDVPAGDGAPLKIPGRWIVESVAPESGGLRMRAYGSDARSTIDATAIRHLKPAPYDPATERAEMAASGLGAVSRDFFVGMKGLPEDGATAATEAVSRAAVAHITTDPVWHETSAGRTRMWQAITSAVHEALPQASGEQLQPMIDKFEVNAILAAHGMTADSVKNPTHLKGLPDAFIEHHRDALAGHLRRRALAYDEGDHRGTYGLVIDGKAAPAESYSGRSALEKPNTRLLLPTESDRQMAKDAYKRYQHEMQFEWHYSSSNRRGNHSTKDLPGVKLSHPQFRHGQIRGNPMHDVIDKLYPGLEAEATAEIRADANTAARAAPTFREAFRALVPTINALYGGIVKWPADDIRLLADKAVETGVLQQRVDSVLGERYAAGAFDMGNQGFKSSLLGYALAAQLQLIDPDRAREISHLMNEKKAA